MYAAAMLCVMHSPAPPGALGLHCSEVLDDERVYVVRCMQGGRSSHVGAQAEVARDGVQDIGVARGLLPDVQLHHRQPKALHLYGEASENHGLKL